jgi:hypothetical protein
MRSEMPPELYKNQQKVVEHCINVVFRLFHGLPTKTKRFLTLVLVYGVPVEEAGAMLGIDRPKRLWQGKRIAPIVRAFHEELEKTAQPIQPTAPTEPWGRCHCGLPATFSANGDRLCAEHGCKAVGIAPPEPKPKPRPIVDPVSPNLADLPELMLPTGEGVVESSWVGNWETVGTFTQETGYITTAQADADAAAQEREVAAEQAWQDSLTRRPRLGGSHL